MGRLLDFRRKRHAHRRRLAFAIAIASCVVVALGVIAIARYSVGSESTPANLAILSQTVDLWNVGTIRGEQPRPLESVSLPAGLVRVTIVLPRFSTAGRYAVFVTRDQSGGDVIAQNSAVAVSSGDKETLTLELDLRKANAGRYFLATTHEQDQAAYYYPLQIK